LVPGSSPTNSNLFEFVGPVPGTSPTNYACSLLCTVRGTGPCDQMKIFHRMFYFFPVDLVCIGSLDRTVVFLCSCTSNIGHLLTARGMYRFAVELFQYFVVNLVNSVSLLRIALFFVSTFRRISVKVP